MAKSHIQQGKSKWHKTKERWGRGVMNKMVYLICARYIAKGEKEVLLPIEFVSHILDMSVTPQDCEKGLWVLGLKVK
jgi:cellulose synthase/poly-beta-1,6-N-acetylglucosamine synthase-like glycosyltransferase